MSLTSIGSKIKSGAKDLTGGNFKSIAMHLGIGAAIGAIVSLLMRAVQLYLINVYLPAYAKYDGFSIYPNGTSVFVEDIILIVATVALLFTKKLWFTVGFAVGWYSSNYMGLYAALGLPTPTPVP